MSGARILLAFGMGFLGGFGHCVGMCGPIVLAFGLAAPGMPPRRALPPQLAYHLGRVTTYALIGAAMGLTGSFVNLAGRLAGFQDAVAVMAGGLMIALGLAAAAGATSVRWIEARLSGKIFGAVRRVVAGGPGGAYPLGLLLGFLPCGLSYSAFAGAAATGGLVPGLLFALAFAVGTVPALLAAGWATSLASARLRGLLYRGGGVLVILLGSLFVLRGLRLHAPL